MKKDLKIAAITPKVFIGNIKKNTAAIINEINNCNADLAVLPKNAVTGEIYDMRNFSIVAKNTIVAVKKIAANIHTSAIIGFPFYDCDLAAFIKNKKVQGVVILNDSPTETLAEIPFNVYNRTLSGPYQFIMDNGLKLVIASEKQLEESYNFFDEKPNIIAVPASYPAYIGGFENKKSAVRKMSFRNSGAYCILACSHPSDSTKDYVRAGDKIIASKGQILAASTLDTSTFTTSSPETIPLPTPIDTPFVHSFDIKDKNEAFEIIARGIYYRLSDISNKKVILGLSGGLDSACVLLLAVNTFDKYQLDRKNIIALSMPSHPTSDRTKNNAQTLAAELGVSFFEIPIAQSTSRHLRRIGHLKKDVVYENTQARERAKILLDLSNKHGALLLGTSNMIESALGFSTYGGDILAHYNPINSLTKSAVKSLVTEYINQNNDNADLVACLKDILATPISPELKKGQETENILGPYPLHEYFLLRMLAFNEAGSEIVEGAINAFPKINKMQIKKYYKLFINRFFKNRFKSSFSCDGIKLFSYDLSRFNICWNFSNDLFL